MRSLAAAPLLVSALVGGLAPAQTRGAAALRVDDFRAGAVDVDGRSYPYRLLEPLPELAHAPRPLVVFLHGAGERGDDNERQLTWLPAVLGRRELRERLPCYLLAVQCPQDERWVETPWGEAVSEPLAPAPSPALRAVMVAMDRIVATRRVDRGRVYVTGLSMGGYGTWDLAARLPDRFAAALPVCGGGDERSAGRLAGLPISVWHGGADKVVPVARSRVMVATLRALGVPVDYRELDGVGHDAWKRAYGDDGALPWLFAQDQRQQGRGSFASWAVVPQPSGAAGERGRFVVGKDAACVADAGARAAGELFCRALVLETGRRLELRGVAAASQPGDVEFRLAADAAVPVEIAIGDRMVVTARDVEAARRGAAAALQALCTWPDLCCPCGRFDVAMPAGGRVIVGGGSLAWSGAQAMRLVRVAWLFGADEIRGIDLSGYDLATRAAVLDEAGRFGVALEHGDGSRRAAGAVFALERPFDLASVLARPASEPTLFELTAPPGTPERILRTLLGALPAVAESAAGRRPPAVAVLAGRIGALLRYATLR